MSRIRRFFNRRNSIFGGIATLIVVFGLLFASAPTAQAYSTAVWTEFLSTGGGGGIARADCVVGASGGVIRSFEAERTWALTHFHANCANLNAAGTELGSWQRNLGPYGSERNVNTYGISRCDLEPGGNKVVIGAKVHKDPNGFVIGIEVRCGTLPTGSYYSTRPVLGLTSGNVQDIDCPANQVALGLYVAYGGILDKFGLRCGPVSGADQSSLSITSTTGTFGSPITLQTSGGSGAGSVSYTVSGTGCSITSGSLSKTAAGTCTVTATKAGGTNYDPVSSPATTITFNKANQTISFADPGTKERETTFASGATASSSLTVSIASSTTGVCTTSGLNITTVTTGTCTIVASQSGNGNYNAATDVTRSFTIQDTTPPVMTVSSNPSTLASGASSTITFSSTESTTTFSASDVSATLGTLSSFSGSGTTYTATFTASPTSGGTAVITVASGSFTDSAGNANTSARSGSVTVTNTVASSGGRSNYLSNGASGTGTNGTRYIVERFTSTPVGGTWRVPQGVTAIDLLVVGGGGGGGGRHRGGGGGGGYADITGYAVSPGTNYSVTVGTGGSGSPAGSGGDGTVGNSSSFLLSGNGITANGGAGSNYTTGGASGTATRTGPTNGTVVAMTTSSIAGGTGRVNDCGSWDWCGGGGGGASLEGSNAVSTGGAGGSGRTSTITGTSVTYAGGGGGSSGESDSNTPSNGATAGGSGGSGGGGAGRSATPTISCTTATAGDPGTAELGGGGGAGGYCNRAANGTALFTAAGGAGGSGIVVVRYAVPSVSTPVLHSDDDLGAPLDNITSATTLTFTGSAAVGSTVQLYVDNVASGSTCPASSTTGEWSCDTGVLTSGAKKVKAFSTTLLSDSTVTSESAEMTVTVDTTAPTVSIAANASTLKSGQTSTLTFTLSEASNDFVVGDITVSGGTLSSFTGSGTSYTVVFTPTTNTQSGTGSVSVALGTFTDAAGNSNTASFATTITYDTQAASVSSLSVSSSAGADSTYVAGDSIRVTVNFSEAVTVTGTPTISVLVGSTTRSATYISGSGTSALVFGYTVVAGDTDTDGVSVTLNSLDLGGGTINDAAGNASTLTQVAVAASTSHKVDTTAPTVTIAATSTTLRSSQTSTLTFTLSEASSNFVEGDITFSGGTLSSFTAVSGTSYTVVFTPTTNTQSGSGSISVAVDKFTDAAGNNNTASSATTITYDTQAPSVSIAASVSTLKSGENSTLTFTLSEASTNFVEGDITFSGGTLSSFSGSGTSYTVVFTPTANTQSETGSVSVAADKFTDTAGNNNTASSTTTITYDTRVPTVSNVTSSSTNGTFSVGSTVSIQVVFSEAVTVSGTPRLTLETGSTDRAVDYASGSGTTSLTFTYTVQAGDSATDLDYVGTSSLALNGGSIVDAASNAATLTLPTPGATGSLGENKDIVVTSAPTKVVSVRTPVGTASGAAFTTQPQVSLQDLGSNVVTNDSATVVTATVSDGATLVGTRTATASNGVATFSNLGISGTAGTAYTITYSASYGGSALTVATQSVTPTVGAATQISITTQPVGATAGALLSTQPVVKVLDSGSNVVTTASASIEVSASGGTLGGTTTVSTSSGVATFTNLTFAGTATTNYTLTFAATGYTSQTSSSFSVGVGAATKLVLTTSAATAKYGQAFTTQPVVKVQDAGSNVVTASSAVVTASLSSGTVVGTGNATSSSGVATFSGLGITGAPGSYTVTYSSGSLTTASQVITVGKADQTVTFEDPADRAWSADTFVLSPTASSGSDVTLTSGTTSVCTVLTLTVTMLREGTCTLTAAQAGNDNFNAASSVTQSFSISFATQATLSVSSSSTITYGSTMTLATSGGSSVGLVSYGVTGDCTISGTALTATGNAAATCVVTATKAGDTQYAQATATQTVTIAKSPSNSITFDALLDRAWSASTFTLSPTATSGDTPALTSTTTGVCTVSSLTITMVSSGTCSLTASEDGNGNYLAATNVVRSFEISRVTPSAATWADVTATYGDVDQLISPPTVSFGGSTVGGSWTYASADAAVVALSSATMDFGSFGSTTITGSFTPTDTGKYNDVVATLNVSVGKIRPLFSWTNVSKTFGDASFSLTAPTVTNSVTGSWSYSSATDSVVSTSGSTATVVGAGTSTITATFTPTDTTNYVSGGTVAMTVTVEKATPTFSWAGVTATFGDANSAIVAPTVATTAATGTWAYTSATTSVVAISGTDFDFGNAGSSVVTATFTPSNTTNYVSGGTVTMTVSVARVTPLFSWSNVSATFGDANATITAPTVTGSIAGTWSYSSATTSVVAISGSSYDFGNVGTSLITATFTPTDTTNYVSGGTATMTVSVATADQTALTVTSLLGTYGSTVSLATSGGTTNGSVSYSATGDGCTVSGGTLSRTNAGDCSVIATMVGSSNYNAVSSLATTVTFAKANQSGLSITTTSGTYGIDLTLNVGGGTTNGSVTYVATGVGCSQTGGVLTKSTAGDCSVTATMAGNSNYNAVSSTATTVTFVKASQSALTLTSTLGTYGTPLTLGYSGGLGTGAISYAVSGTGCSITSGVLSKDAAGDCSVTVTKATDTNYEAVSSSSTTVTFAQAPNSITFGTLSNRAWSASTFTLSPSATSGDTPALTSTTTGVCTVSSLTITMVSSGTCSLTASEDGNGNYLAATDVVRSFEISRVTPSAATWADVTATYGDVDQLISPPTVSFGGSTVGGSWTYSSADAAVVALSSATMDFGSFGSTTITGSFTPTDTGKYNNVVATLNVSVEKVRPLFSWTNVSKTFGDVSFSLTAPTVTNSVPGSWSYSSATVSVVSTSGSTATVVGAGTSTITATFTPTDTTNYVSGGTVAMTVTVEKATPTFSWAGVTATFGDANSAITAPTVATTAATGTWAYTSATTSVVAISGTDFDFGNAGSSVVTATFTPSNTTNYVSGGTVTMTVTISQADQAALSVASTNGTYGTPLTLTTSGGTTNGSVSWLVADGSATSCAVTSGALSARSIGTCTVTAIMAGDTNYKSVTSLATAVRLAQRSITVTAENKNKIYGETDPSLTYEVTTGNMAGSDTLTGSLTRLSGVNAGDYSITQGNLTNSNYAITFVPGTLTIGRKPITVAAVDKTKQYGETDPALTYSITNGSPLVEGDSFAGALSRAGGAGVGTHAIQQGNLALSNNYTLTFVGATLTIEARDITVTADVKTKQYGEVDPALTYEVTTGSLVLGDSFSGALVRNPGASVGTYTITQGTLDLSANYNLAYVSADLTVTAKPITITANTLQTKVYGETDPTFQYEITSGLLESGDSLSGSLSRSSGSAVGTYALNIGTLENSNYNISFVPANFAITTRPITITATARTKVYGQNDPSLVFTVTSGSLVGSDALSGSLSRASGDDAGTYAITRGTVANSNYAITYVGNDLTIERATQNALSVTTSQITYGTSVVLGSSGGSGNGDVSYAVSSSGSAGCSIADGTLSATGGVGTTCTVAVTKAQSANHNAATSSAATITVINRAITVTATSARKNYGDTDPELLYTITSGALVAGDTLSGALGRASGEGVGTHSITRGTLANANYTITYVGANLTIDPRPITVRADNKTKVFGQPDPQLTYEITSGNLIGSETLSGSISRNTGDNIGSYAIGRGNLANSSYAITFIDATLSVTGADQSGFTLDAASTSIIYGDSTTLSTSGGNGDGAVSYSVTDGTGSCTISGDTITAVAAGTCIVTATKAQEGNYNRATSNDLTINVARRAQVITFAQPADRNFTTASFSLAPTVDSGNSATLASQTTNVCTVSGTSVTMLNSGTCELVASVGGTANYNAAPDVTRSFVISPVVPFAPTLNSLTASDGAISASFALGSSGGSSLLNHEYSLDNGVTWTAWPTGSITSPLNIGGLANGVEYQVMVRAINIVGQGAASNMLAVTPIAPVIVPASASSTSVESTSTTVVSSTTTVFVVTTVTRNPGRALPTTTVARRAVTTTISQRDGQLTTTTTIRLTTTTTGLPTTTVERVPASAQRTTQTTTQNTIQTQTSVFESISPLAPVTRVPDTIPRSLAPTKSAAVVGGFTVSMDVRRVNNEQVVATLGKSTLTMMSLSDNGAPEPLLANGSIAVTAGGTVRVSGTGMLPAEPIEVWMYSTPVKLGEVIAGADGSFSAELVLPSDAQLGSHKLQFVGKTVDGAEMMFAQGISVVDDTVLTMNRAGELNSATADNLGKDNVVSISTMSKDDAANIMLWFLVIMILVAGLLAAQPRRKSITLSPVQRIEIATPWLAGMRLPRMLMLLVGVLAGFGAANSASFSATAPSTLWVAVLIIVGLLDVMAGGVAGLVFAISVVAGGSVGSMLDIRITALVVLIATLPNAIGRAARPHGARFAVQSAITAVLNVTVVVSLVSLFAPVGGVNYELSAWLVELSWVAALASAGRFVLLRITQSSNDHYDAHIPALRVVGVVSAAAFVVGTNVATIWTLAAIVVLAVVVIFGLRIRVGLSVQHVRKVFVGSIAISLALVIAATGTLTPQGSRDEVTDASQITPIGELNVIGQLDVLIDGYPRTFVAINTGVGEITFINGSVGQSLTIESWSKDNERIPLAADNTLHLVRGEHIVIRANGYAANETMDAWLFSNPVFVGNAPTNGDGKLETRFVVPVGKNDGMHTLQIRLVGEDGKVVSYSIPAVLSSVVPNTEA